MGKQSEASSEKIAALSANKVGFLHKPLDFKRGLWVITSTTSFIYVALDSCQFLGIMR